MLFARMAMSSTCAVAVHVLLEVLKQQPNEPTSSHLSRGLRTYCVSLKHTSTQMYWWSGAKIASIEFFCGI